MKLIYFSRCHLIEKKNYLKIITFIDFYIVVHYNFIIHYNLANNIFFYTDNFEQGYKD